MTDKTKQQHGGVAVNHRRQIPRLRRIEGQVRGLQQMIEEERHCIDVAHQISAVRAALQRVEADMLRDHLQAIIEATVTSDLPASERRQLADEVANLIAKLM